VGFNARRKNLANVGMGDALNQSGGHSSLHWHPQ
jgi:hypothetical protein